MSQYPISLAIHGGAGTILRSTMTPELQAQYEEGLKAALDAGYSILESGGSSLDAVEASVKSLEDFPLFNAGRGAVFTYEGGHELDAAIMDGHNLGCGAVAGVRGVANPVSLARAVMERSEHVLLTGEGAAAFAQTQGFAILGDDYFYNELRHQQWSEAVAAGRMQLDHTAAASADTGRGGEEEAGNAAVGNASALAGVRAGRKFGTVGAVALDAAGNLAAATSTGGMTAKRWGRVGDTPIVGAGTWASNDTCAISCTGHGEYFIKAVVAHDIHCLMLYKGLSLREACDMVVMDKLVKLGGEGGLIAVDGSGNIAMPFNSEGMYRASRKGDKMTIHIYKD